MEPRKRFISAFQLRLILLAAIVLGVFALYAGSLRLVTFHDDVLNIEAIRKRTLLDLFELRPYGTGYYRPVSFVPWLVVRDLFGWFQPAILHLWNLGCHMLNTALVAMLATRLGPLFGLRSGII